MFHPKEVRASRIFEPTPMSKKRRERKVARERLEKCEQQTKWIAEKWSRINILKGYCSSNDKINAYVCNLTFRLFLVALFLARRTPLSRSRRSLERCPFVFALFGFVFLAFRQFFSFFFVAVFISFRSPFLSRSRSLALGRVAPSFIASSSYAERQRFQFKHQQRQIKNHWEENERKNCHQPGD